MIIFASSSRTKSPTCSSQAAELPVVDRHIFFCLWIKVEKISLGTFELLIPLTFFLFLKEGWWWWW